MPTRSALLSLQYLLHFEELDENFAVTVERSPASIADSLPQALAKKRFGTQTRLPHQVPSPPVQIVRTHHSFTGLWASSHVLCHMNVTFSFLCILKLVQFQKALFFIYVELHVVLVLRSLCSSLYLTTNLLQSYGLQRRTAYQIRRLYQNRNKFLHQTIQCQLRLHKHVDRRCWQKDNQLSIQCQANHPYSILHIFN